MLRPNFTLFRRVIPSLKEQSLIPRVMYSSKSRQPKSAARLTLVSASVGVLVGAGYGGYTHYKINMKKGKSVENDDYAFLVKAPEYKPHYKVINESDTSNLHLVLFQYRTCPFCCKVRAYLDARGISYEVVEVDAVLRQAIKWSGYKKVPILLVKVEGGYQQLLDSTAIISILETYLRDKSAEIRNLIQFYPVQRYLNEDGKDSSDISNKYFIMHNAPIGTEKEKIEENEERKWRQWADRNLVHMLSPNVYRTPGEALETFEWFSEVGGWKESFPAWEVALMVYGGALAMYFISKRLKKRHHLEDNVRLSLYDSANKWLDAIRSKGTKFLGGDQPNLADITVYGVLSSIEGCQAFQDLRINTGIGKWFDDIKEEIQKQKGKTVPALEAESMK